MNYTFHSLKDVRSKKLSLNSKSVIRYFIYLVIGPNGFLTFLAVVGEKFLVAGYAVWMLLLQDVATRDQLLIAVLACQMILVVVLIHCLRILCRKYQLKIHK